MRPECLALRFNYSCFKDTFPLCALFSSSPGLSTRGLLLPSPPQVPCVSKGPFTRVLAPFRPLICILCSAKGVRRAHGEARWLTSSLRKHAAIQLGTFPVQGRGRGRCFRGSWFQCPSLKGQFLFPSWGFLPETAFLKRSEKRWKGRMGKDNQLNLWPLPRHKFCSFNPTEIGNQKLWMKRYRTMSVKP